jgi:hypothetical protein
MALRLHSRSRALPPINTDATAQTNPANREGHASIKEPSVSVIKDSAFRRRKRWAAEPDGRVKWRLFLRSRRVARSVCNSTTEINATISHPR